MKIIDISEPLVAGKNLECIVPQDLPVYEGFACEEYAFRFKSHVGCYYETSGHLFRNGKMTCDVPVRDLFLPAWIARLNPKKRGAIEPAELAAAVKGEIEPGDALLVDTQGNDRRHFSRAAGAWMAEKRLGLLGATLALYDTGFANPTGVFVELFRAEIPIIAAIRNVEQITHPRVFLIVLPMAVERVCTVPCRAVVLDGEPSEIDTLAGILHPR